MAADLPCAFHGRVGCRYCKVTPPPKADAPKAPPRCAVCGKRDARKTAGGEYVPCRKCADQGLQAPGLFQ